MSHRTHFPSHPPLSFLFLLLSHSPTRFYWSTPMPAPIGSGQALEWTNRSAWVSVREGEKGKREGGDSGSASGGTSGVRLNVIGALKGPG
ncbi:hypothetical protein L798_06621 [Zootermopsis nevadensis]|uniref:Secreted protein n=1 Tax=Zootermopsis nevadensis TaxID=136037 RepID=A0A067R5S6_ZOONE|nr:hypothetical protein L798_06621 [Zootermopsis nevadensis]